MIINDIPVRFANTEFTHTLFLTYKAFLEWYLHMNALLGRVNLVRLLTACRLFCEAFLSSVNIYPCFRIGECSFTLTKI